MNKQGARVGVFLKLLGVFSVIGFHSIAQAAAVSLEVSGDHKKLVVTTPGACGHVPPKPGCMKASGRNTKINFSLKNSSCTSGDTWELDHVALGNSKNSVGNISDTAAHDFNADKTTGVVTPLGTPTAKHIQIRDYNSEEYVIWYTVYATCGGATISSDPRIENDGSGHR